MPIEVENEICFYVFHIWFLVTQQILVEIAYVVLIESLKKSNNN